MAPSDKAKWVFCTSAYCLAYLGREGDLDILLLFARSRSHVIIVRVLIHAEESVLVHAAVILHLSIILVPQIRC